MINKFGILWMFLFVSTPSFAGKNSCAHMLRTEARAYLALSTVPIVGHSLSPILVNLAFRLIHDADRLKAAHIYTNFNEYDDKDVDNAKEILNAFYDKLRKRYPQMNLTEQKVIETLNNVYVNGVRDGYCKSLLRPQASLAKNTFFSGALDFYESRVGKDKTVPQAQLDSTEFQDEQKANSDQEDVPLFQRY